MCSICIEHRQEQEVQIKIFFSLCYRCLKFLTFSTKSYKKTQNVETWISCVHCVFNIISRMLLDRIWGDWTSLDDYFIMLSCFVDQNIRNYIKIDHDDQNQNIKIIIKMWLSCVHYGFNIITRMFLDRIWGDWTSFDDYSIILSCFIDQMYGIMSKLIMMIKIKILILWSKYEYCVYITDSISWSGCF